MKNVLILFIGSLLLVSCKNLVPYSDSLRQKYNLEISDLKRIQFYASDAIVLQRKFIDGNTNIVSGKIKTINGEKVEEVIIRSGTPGVLVQDDKGKLSISFESSDNYYLNFGSNPNMNSNYSIAFLELKNRVGKVMYNNAVYYTAPESVNAILMVDMRKVSKYEINQRIAKGRKIK